MKKSADAKLSIRAIVSVLIIYPWMILTHALRTSFSKSGRRLIPSKANLREAHLGLNDYKGFVDVNLTLWDALVFLNSPS